MYNKEKRLRKDSSSIGFGLFLITVLEIVSILLVKRFIRINIYLNDHIDLIRKSTDILIYLLIPMIVFSLMLKIKEKNFKSIVNFNFKREKFWIYILISFFIISFANIVTAVFGEALKLIHIKSTMPNFNFGDSALSIFLSIIRIAIIPAIGEEFVFRGAILNILKPYGGKFAILSSAFLFGVYHGNVDQFTFAFLTGLYFGYVTYKTESIIPSVVMHFINNFLSSISTVYKRNNEIRLILSEFIFIVGVIGFIFFISMLFKNSENLKFSNIFKKNKKRMDIKFSDKLNALIFNPGMTLFLILMLMIFYFSLEIVY